MREQPGPIRPPRRQALDSNCPAQPPAEALPSAVPILREDTHPPHLLLRAALMRVLHRR